MSVARGSRSSVPFVVAIAVVALLGSFVSVARAEHAPPLPLPLVDRQAPEREDDPLVRRPVEVQLATTVAWLGCSGSAPRALGVADPCATLGAGYGLTGALYYRPTPRAQLGPSAALTRFSWDAARVFEGARPTGEATWTTAGLVGRVSFLDEGRLDPWMSAFAGLGFLRMDAGGDRRLTRTGFFTRAAIGLDVWLSGRWKLTSHVEAAWQPGSAAERCEGGVCLDGGSLARIPGRSLGAGLGVALALGDAL